MNKNINNNSEVKFHKSTCKAIVPLFRDILFIYINTVVLVCFLTYSVSLSLEFKSS